MARLKTKTKTKKPAKRVTSVSIRENAKRDTSPTWDDCIKWPIAQFQKNYYAAMQYYNLEFNPKDLKPAVLKWMATKEYDTEVINKFKKTEEWRCSPTMGAIASCLLRGMVPQREDFNQGRNSEDWLRNSINFAIERSSLTLVEEPKSDAPVVTIQERVRETTINMVEDLDDHIEQFLQNKAKYDLKKLNVLNLLKAKQVKSAHARIIKEFYASDLADFEELAGKPEEQLKESYSSWTKKQIQSYLEYLREIHDACNMLAQEAKITRKPKAKKPIAKDKIVAKLKYKKTDDALKLVSLDPVDIIGSKELWVYNTKNRKLGKYIANEHETLNIKGSSIIGFEVNTSIQKTLRKPAEKLKEFKTAGKVALRKFLDDINATDTMLNGRINEEIILLKVIH